MEIQRSSQDYLEAMLILKEKHGYIRSVDIAERLGVAKPSVTYATKRLKESGYIIMDRDGAITLTDKGMEVASDMLRRHKTLAAFLVNLGVEPSTAEQDACRLEHDLSPESFDAIVNHVEKIMPAYFAEIGDVSD